MAEVAGAHLGVRLEAAAGQHDGLRVERDGATLLDRLHADEVARGANRIEEILRELDIPEDEAPAEDTTEGDPDAVPESDTAPADDDA